jgi:hypothetical protein
VDGDVALIDGVEVRAIGVGNQSASRYESSVIGGERERPLMRRSAAGDDRMGRAAGAESWVGAFSKGCK